MTDRTPVEQFELHREKYEYITQRVEETRKAFLEADRPVQRVMLNQAVSFALISTNTRVENHEAGYIGVVNNGLGSDPDENMEVLRDAGVNYCGNKANYIFHNMTEADPDRVIDHVESEEYVEALQATIEEFKGVACAKGAYALAKLGVPKMACLDRHVSGFLGIEDVYSGVVAEKYIDQVSALDDLDVSDETAHRFITQWVVFDLQRERGVAMHDAYFMSLPTNDGGVTA